MRSPRPLEAYLLGVTLSGCSPTWRILRALQAIIKANVVIGESRLTAAPFFEGAGRPSGPFWGPQQGRRVILWESLSPEDQQKCLNDLF